jgi:hypothetical protein
MTKMIFHCPWVFTQLQELGKHNITLFLWIMVYSRFPFSQDVIE